MKVAASSVLFVVLCAIQDGTTVVNSERGISNPSFRLAKERSLQSSRMPPKYIDGIVATRRYKQWEYGGETTTHDYYQKSGGKKNKGSATHYEVPVDDDGEYYYYSADPHGKGAKLKRPSEQEFEYIHKQPKQGKAKAKDTKVQRARRVLNVKIITTSMNTNMRSTLKKNIRRKMINMLKKVIQRNRTRRVMMNTLKKARRCT